MSTVVQQLDVKGLADAIGEEAAAETVRAMMPDDLRAFADAMRDTFGAKLAYMKVPTEAGAIEVGRREPVDPEKVWRPGEDFDRRAKARNQPTTRAQRSNAAMRYK